MDLNKPAIIPNNSQNPFDRSGQREVATVDQKTVYTVVPEFKKPQSPEFLGMQSHHDSGFNKMMRYIMLILFALAFVAIVLKWILGSVF